MSLTIEQAIDSVYLFTTTAWDAEATGVSLNYDETPSLNDMPGDNVNKQPEAKVILVADLIDSNQATLGASPNRRFRRTGVLTVRIMTPRKQGRLLEDQYAKIIFDSLEGECTPEGVDFFKLTPLVGFTVGAYRVKQINVEFEYDEIK